MKIKGQNKEKKEKLPKIFKNTKWISGSDAHVKIEA